MSRTFFLLPFFCLLSASVCAQHIEFIEANTGFLIFSAAVPNYKNIRANVPNFGNSQNSPLSLRGTYDDQFGSIKLGFVSNRLSKWTFSTGLKYSRMSSQIRSKTFALIDANEYFFYKFRESGSITEYLTIANIRQKTDYLGIPLEARFYPFRPRRFGLFLKASAEVNLNLHSSTEVDFHDPAMRKFESQVADDFASPEELNAIFFLGPGFHFGRTGKPRFGFETALPAFFINTHAGGIVQPGAGGGFIFFISLPVNYSSNE
jgi:hypothetical protein